jgi:hypothetical protein
MDPEMDPETLDRFFALLRKTEADVVADWKWPIWPPDGEERPPRDD